ncbi:MAG: sporulation protein [Clostridiales bacterium]|nr:sporulation protein [Clostridiales bacterium]
MENNNEHSLTLTNRENLSLTGIEDVDYFNEQEIMAICDCGELTIKGELLHVEEMNVESGLLVVSGKITSLTYSEKFTSTSLIKRLFGG